MNIQRTEFESPIEALLNLSHVLTSYEDRYSMTSKEFYTRYCAGALSDERDYVEWAGDYQHFIALKAELENRLEVTT